MDLGARRRRTQKLIFSDSLTDLYPHDVTLYPVPPSNEIALHEFEEIALERVQLLRILENAGLKGHIPFTDDWRACVREDLNKSNLKKFSRLLSGSLSTNELDLQARRVDHISHFILRIAYCRSEELRRWFLNRELEWFRVKFLSQTHEGIKQFLQVNSLSYKPISQEERETHRSNLICSTSGLNINVFDTTEFYKVPFTEVCSLVKSRRVYLSEGYAFIPASELVVCVQSKFRALLNEQLAIYYRRFPLLDDDRLADLLNNLHNIHTGNSYAKDRTDKDSIDPAELDSYAKNHYPLCMKYVHGVLKSTHHLKHQARLQYGLFLKAMGLLFEDAVNFWREEFTKAMDSGKFDKEYLYNIRHMYGKVGRMVSYAPYSCIKIITSGVTSGQHHGCPFKHWDQTIIKQKLMEDGLSSEVANEIKELAQGGHFQIACGKYFEVKHGKASSNGINHPNQYVEESVKIEKEKN